MNIKMNTKVLYVPLILAMLSLSCKSQKEDVYFRLTSGPMALTVPSEGVTQEYTIETNMSWQLIAQGGETWAKAEPESGENSGRFQVVVEENNTEIERSLALVFVLDGKEQKVKISIFQEGAEAPPPPPDPEYPIIFNSFKVRDPFIFVDPVSQRYYLHASARDGGHYPSATYLDMGAYESKDLYNWKRSGISFAPGANFWGKTDGWAPDLYLYKGKYYMFPAYSGSNGIRGSAILVSDKPEGPFAPLINAPITPVGMQALDAILWVDDAGQPWLVYSGEWTQFANGNGTIVAQKLTDDLKAAADQPVTLFAGSDGPWVRRRNIYVTDAPFLYKASNGDLIMLWSSFIDVSGPEIEHYAIGIARSKSGNILGPWSHESVSLNPDDNGGHAMIFRDLKGKLRISYHSPNIPSGQERITIHTLLDNNGAISIRF
jgi:hypothetical protein